MPLSRASQLHAWLHDSLQRARQAAPGNRYQADVEPLLPVTASKFFTHYSTADPSFTTALPRSLNAKAHSYLVEAAVQRMRELSRRGERWQFAHHKAITAKGAWGWKVVKPESPQLRLSDVEYAVAARLNLDLQPFSRRATTARHQDVAQAVSVPQPGVQPALAAIRVRLRANRLCTQERRYRKLKEVDDLTCTWPACRTILPAPLDNAHYIFVSCPRHQAARQQLVHQLRATINHTSPLTLAFISGEVMYYPKPTRAQLARAIAPSPSQETSSARSCWIGAETGRSSHSTVSSRWTCTRLH